MPQVSVEDLQRIHGLVASLTERNGTLTQQAKEAAASRDHFEGLANQYKRELASLKKSERLMKAQLEDAIQSKDDALQTIADLEGLIDEDRLKRISEAQRQAETALAEAESRVVTAVAERDAEIARRIASETELASLRAELRDTPSVQVLGPSASSPSRLPPKHPAAEPLVVTFPVIDTARLDAVRRSHSSPFPRPSSTPTLDADAVLSQALAALSPSPSPSPHARASPATIHVYDPRGHLAASPVPPISYASSPEQTPLAPRRTDDPDCAFVHASGDLRYPTSTHAYPSPPPAAGLDAADGDVPSPLHRHTPLASFASSPPPTVARGIAASSGYHHHRHLPDDVIVDALIDVLSPRAAGPSHSPTSRHPHALAAPPLSLADAVAVIVGSGMGPLLSHASGPAGSADGVDIVAHAIAAAAAAVGPPGGATAATPNAPLFSDRSGPWDGTRMSHSSDGRGRRREGSATVTGTRGRGTDADSMPRDRQSVGQPRNEGLDVTPTPDRAAGHLSTGGIRADVGASIERDHPPCSPCDPPYFDPPLTARPAPATAAAADRAGDPPSRPAPSSDPPAASRRDVRDGAATDSATTASTRPPSPAPSTPAARTAPPPPTGATPAAAHAGDRNPRGGAAPTATPAAHPDTVRCGSPMCARVHDIVHASIRIAEARDRRTRAGGGRFAAVPLATTPRTPRGAATTAARRTASSSAVRRPLTTTAAAPPRSASRGAATPRQHAAIRDPAAPVTSPRGTVRPPVGPQVGPAVTSPRGAATPLQTGRAADSRGVGSAPINARAHRQPAAHGKAVGVTAAAAAAAATAAAAPRLGALGAPPGADAHGPLWDGVLASVCGSASPTWAGREPPVRAGGAHRGAIGAAPRVPLYAVPPPAPPLPSAPNSLAASVVDPPGHHGGGYGTADSSGYGGAATRSFSRTPPRRAAPQLGGTGFTHHSQHSSATDATYGTALTGPCDVRDPQVTVDRARVSPAGPHALTIPSMGGPPTTSSARTLSGVASAVSSVDRGSPSPRVVECISDAVGGLCAPSNLSRQTHTLTSGPSVSGAARSDVDLGALTIEERLAVAVFGPPDNASASTGSRLLDSLMI